MVDVRRMVALVVPFLLPVTGMADGEPWFPVRTHNPYLQIFGMPGFEGAGRQADGRTAWQVTFDLANHADASSSGTESISLDGESYYLNFRLRHGLTEWLEVGVDVPVVAHAEGFMDHVIEGWHDLFGMTNSKRTGPANELEFRYLRDGRTPFAMTDGAAGLGDVRLSAAVPLRFGTQTSGRELSIRASLKLPTGDAGTLRGSGGTDAALGVYGSFEHAFGVDRLGLSANAGILVTGDSDLFPDIQERAVPFGGVAADWRFGSRLRAMAALYAQGAFIDSELDELGGNSIQLMVGGDYRFADIDLAMSFGIVEELFSDATVDFAFQVAVHGRVGGD